MAQNCPCPTDATGTDSNSVDYIDGYPSVRGQYTVTLSDYWFNRDAPYQDEYRYMLGLPDPGSSDTELTLLYKLGSGIKVNPDNPNYDQWMGYRLDCSCLKYVCNDSTGLLSATMTCIADYFTDADGNYDPHPDKINLTPKTILSETISGQYIVLDAVLKNLMTFNTDAADVEAFTGIPETGSFNNYVDTYGIIHAAKWKIVGNQIDIVFMTQDPRIPGESENEGRVIKIGNSLHVFKNGITTITRQIIKATANGLVILGQKSTTEYGEFQTTFDCGTGKSNPFLYYLDNMVTDQVQFISGTVISEDPESVVDETEWWPSSFNGSTDGFKLYGPDLRPLTTLDSQEV